MAQVADPQYPTTEVAVNLRNCHYERNEAEVLARQQEAEERAEQAYMVKHLVQEYLDYISGPNGKKS